MSASHTSNSLGALPATSSAVALGPLVPCPVGANAAVWAVLCTGSLTISLTTESTSNANTPLFLKGLTSTSPHWISTVLPYIRLLTFTIASTTDIFTFTSILQSSQLPSLYQNVTKLNMTGFHWFSGISGNRHTNPYLVLAANLPTLTSVSFTLATGSITTSAWGERQQIQLERTDMNLSKARKVLSVEHVVAKYDIRAFLHCKSLMRIRLEYVVSALMSPHVSSEDAMRCVRGVRDLLKDGFRQQGRAVDVEIKLVS